MVPGTEDLVLIGALSLSGSSSTLKILLQRSKMLLTHEDLLSRLQSHLSKATGLDIAMAWASLGEASNMVLAYARQHPGSVRALIGISGNSTHPNVLKGFRSLTDLRLPYHHPLFHPKLIIFHFNRKSIAWLGSANLTRCGFQQNIELVAEFDDSNDAKDGLINIGKCPLLMHGSFSHT